MAGRNLRATFNRLVTMVLALSTLVAAPGLPFGGLSNVAHAASAAQPASAVAQQPAGANQASVANAAAKSVAAHFAGQSRPFLTTVPSPIGTGSYLAGGNQSPSLNLPVIRTDGNFDSVIHVSNGTGSATNVTLVLYTASGSTAKTVNQSLAARASFDYDVGAALGSGFAGSAIVSSSPTGISAAVDVYNADMTGDNVDSYSGVPTNTTPVSGGYSTWLPLALNELGYTSSVYLQNPTNSTANVTVAFNQQGHQVGGVSQALGPFASTSIPVNGNGVTTFGPVLVTSDQPVVVGGDLSGNGAYSVVVMPPNASASSFTVPEFDYSTDLNGWNTAITVVNTAAAPTTFTVTFYNPDGSVAGTMDSGATPIGPNRLWMAGLVQPVANSLASGYSGPAIISSSAGTAVAVVVQTQGQCCVFNALAGYVPPPAPPSGAAGPTPGPVTVPGLVKNLNGESTAFTVLNTESSAQSYTINVYDQNGNSVNTTSICLAGNSSWTYFSSNDGVLPDGYNGSADVSATSGGLQPVVLASLYVGSFQPPYFSSGNSTCPATATPTPLLSNTPTLTPVQSFTPTLTPTVTNTRIPPPLLGASSYIGGNNQSTQFVLPLVRSDNGYNTIVHLANANAGPATVQVTFYNTDGSPNSDLTRQVQVPTWGLFDFDVLGQHPNFNGSAIVTASQGIALSTDVISTTTGGPGYQPNDAIGSYAGLPSGLKDSYLGLTNSEFQLNSTLNIQNTTGTTAQHVSLTFETSPPVTVQLPPLAGFATAQIDVPQLNAAQNLGILTNWVGTVHIQSDQPVAALSEIHGHLNYTTVTMINPGPNASYFVPQFVNGGTGGWTTGIVLQTVGTSSATFNVTFYNPNGTTALKMPALTLGPQQVKTISPLLGTVSLPMDYQGSAVVTVTGLGMAMGLNVLGGYQILGVTSYAPESNPQAGAWAYLPALRNAFTATGGNQSTAFSLYYPVAGLTSSSSKASQTYKLAYWSNSGALVKTDTVTIQANGSAYFDQALDSTLPVGFEGSIEVKNTDPSGPLPLTIINLYQNLPSLPPPSTATPTVTGTPTITQTPTFTTTPGPGTPSVTPTVTPTSTGTATASPTPLPSDAYEPDNTPALAKPLPLNGIPQIRTFHALGDIDWVTIQVQAGDNVQISTIGATCDAQLWLYDQTSGNPTTVLAMDDDSGPGFSSILTYSFTVSGTYYILARNYVTQSTNAQFSLPGNFGACAYQLVGNLVTNQTPTATATATPPGTVPETPTATATPPGTVPETPTATATPPGTVPTDTATTTTVPTDTATTTTVPTDAATATTVPTDTATATAVPTDTSTATATATFPIGGTFTPTLTPSPTSTIAPAVATFTLPTGTVVNEHIVSNNGQLDLSIPSDLLGTGAEGQNVQVSVKPISLPAGSSVDAASPLLVLEIDLSGAGYLPGTPFAHPITVTMKYDPIQVAALGLDPANLKIYILALDGTVQALPSVVDEVNHTVTASIPHLTKVVLAAPKAVLVLPVAFDSAGLPGW